MAQVQKKNKSKRLSLQNLIRNEKDIWVKNMTGTNQCRASEGRPGNVILMVGTAQDHDRLTVPPGGDPVCLSDQTDYNSIARCRDLFKCIKPGGPLQLIDPSEAEDYYEKHEDRRAAMQQKIENLISEAKHDVNPEEIEGTAIELNSAISDLCLKIKHKATDERAALERLLEIAPILTETDLQYLLVNGKLPSIKRWAKTQLKEMLEGVGEEEPEEEEFEEE